MTKKMNIVNELAVLFVLAMTVIVVLILTKAQSCNQNLEGGERILFLFGFIGSVICLVIRFSIVYIMILKRTYKWTKVIGIMHTIIWNIIFIWSLLMIIEMSNYSISHENLANQ